MDCKTISIPSPALLNEEQAAAVLGLTVKCLQAWRFRRKGPAYRKLGRCVRYSVDDLEAYTASCRIDPASTAA